MLRRRVRVPAGLVTLVCAVIVFFGLLPWLGISASRLWALLVLLAMSVGFFVVYCRYDMPDLVRDDEAVFLTGFLAVFGVFLLELGRIFQGFPSFGVPLAAVSMLATMLLNVRLAVVLTMLLALLAGVINGFSFDHVLVTFLGGVTGVATIRNARHRSDVTRSGLAVAVAVTLSLWILGLFYEWEMPRLWGGGVWALVNGFLCSILTLGCLPMLEPFFSRVTNITLLELSDFNHPLLRRLMVEAPGTYHHTLLVASIAEAAAEAIGANSLLTRVGVYFHDIGKLVQPEYFIENQAHLLHPHQKEKAHDKLRPSISSLVIMAHVKEGQALARSYKLPEDIVKFIPEHHGTSLIKYFYIRALEEGEEETPPDQIYRYPGPKPRSKETVIAMLADSSEAASRALQETTHTRLKDLIEKVINGKFADGQLDEAPVTLADLRTIIDSFTHSLTGIYHTRIEYPDMPEERQASGH